MNLFFRTRLLYRSRYATRNCHLNDNRAFNNRTMLAGGKNAIFIQLRRLPDLSRTNIWQKFVCIYLETDWIHPMSGVDHFINWAVRINVKWWLLFHFHFLWKQIFINRNKISIHLVQLKIPYLNQYVPLKPCLGKRLRKCVNVALKPHYLVQYQFATFQIVAFLWGTHHAFGPVLNFLTYCCQLLYLENSNRLYCDFICIWNYFSRLIFGKKQLVELLDKGKAKRYFTRFIFVF